jgi:hypothetical protein
MTEREAGTGSPRSTRLWAWLLRAALVLAIVYSLYAAVFYGWYASFAGPNRESATVVANIWTAVTVACVAALVASFFRRKRLSGKGGLKG